MRRVTDDASEDWDPAFTPDGKKIVWSSGRSGNLEIWIANTDGTGAKQISQDGVDAENPTATPDGRRVEIRRISEQLQEDTDLIRSLAEQGLRPGATVTARVERDTVSVDGELLPAGVAQHVFVNALDEELTPAQLDYAASDVLHLHALKEKLDTMLAREGRTEIAQSCFDFLPSRAALDLAGWEEVDIFAHS